MVYTYKYKDRENIYFISSNDKFNFYIFNQDHEDWKLSYKFDSLDKATQFVTKNRKNEWSDDIPIVEEELLQKSIVSIFKFDTFWSGK